MHTRTHTRTHTHMRAHTHTHPHTHTPRFSGGSGSKESACNAGDPGSIPGSGRSTGEGNGYPLQYSTLENTVRGILQGEIKEWAAFLLSRGSSQPRDRTQVSHIAEADSLPAEPPERPMNGINDFKKEGFMFGNTCKN